MGLDFLYECPLRLFDAATVPIETVVIGTADEEFEDRMVIVYYERSADPSLAP